MTRTLKEWADKNGAVFYPVHPTSDEAFGRPVYRTIGDAPERADLVAILTRPAVEAGERLGFLPGDVLAKVDPYMRPLFDALYDTMDPEKLNTVMERGTIEVAPLAFMRGRTLNDSFIILDEAQNTTSEQMKMFLTRLGYNSKAVSYTQSPSPRDQRGSRMPSSA